MYSVSSFRCCTATYLSNLLLNVNISWWFRHCSKKVSATTPENRLELVAINALFSLPRYNRLQLHRDAQSCDRMLTRTVAVCGWWILLCTQNSAVAAGKCLNMTRLARLRKRHIVKRQTGPRNQLRVATDSVCVMTSGLPLEEVMLSPDAPIQSKLELGEQVGKGMTTALFVDFCRIHGFL